VAWGVIASLYVGNLVLVILNLPFIPLWVAVLRVPYAILYTVILGFCVLGAYSLNGSVFDVGVMTAFGVLGYLLRKLDIPAAPLVLTMVLGPLMERALRQSLEISGGDASIFFTRPISAAALAIAAAFAVTSLLQVARSVKSQDVQV
jgi:putative tricarboxylic transport membrane protein